MLLRTFFLLPNHVNHVPGFVTHVKYKSHAERICPPPAAVLRTAEKRTPSFEYTGVAFIRRGSALARANGRLRVEHVKAAHAPLLTYHRAI